MEPCGGAGLRGVAMWGWLSPSLTLPSCPQNPGGLDHFCGSKTGIQYFFAIVFSEILGPFLKPWAQKISRGLAGPWLGPCAGAGLGGRGGRPICGHLPSHSSRPKTMVSREKRAFFDFFFEFIFGQDSFFSRFHSGIQFWDPMLVCNCF